MVDRAKAILDKGLTWISIVLFIGIIFSTNTGVFTRYVLHNPADWTEELTVYLQVWLTFLGAPLGFLCASHIGIDFLPDALNARRRLILVSFCYGSIFVFSVFMFVKGILLTTVAWRDMAETMSISKGVIYLSLPICAVMTMCTMVLDWVGRFRELKSHKEENR